MILGIAEVTATLSPAERSASIIHIEDVGDYLAQLPAMQREGLSLTDYLESVRADRQGVWPTVTTGGLPNPAHPDTQATGDLASAIAKMNAVVLAKAPLCPLTGLPTTGVPNTVGT